jgi:hypothetical protein
MLPISCTLQPYTDYLHPSQNFEVLRFLPSITCRRIMVGRHSRTARILQIYCGMCTPAQAPPSMQSLEVSQSIIDSFEKAIVGNAGADYVEDDILFGGGYNFWPLKWGGDQQRK